MSVFFIGNARIISAIKLKRYVVGTGILGIIVGKLRHKKKPCLIILLKLDKSSEVGFYCTILPLRLAVRLQIESDGEFLFDAKEIT